MKTIKVNTTTTLSYQFVTVLPDGSPGSPGWSEMCRRPSHPSSQPTQNHLKPEDMTETQNETCAR